MYNQLERIRNQQAMTVTSTYKLELPKHGFLGSLLLQMQATGVDGYGQLGGDYSLVDKISRIEVIGNGSTVIKSLTGKQLQALACFDQGVMPPASLRNFGANVQFDSFLINFGRFLYDPEMYLDLERFDNVELWITNTGSATTLITFVVDVIAFWQREASKAGYLGYMRSESWKQWTTVQDEWIYNTLPTEHLVRRILLQAIPAVGATFINACQVKDLMYDIKLSLETGRLKIYDGGMKELFYENYLDMGKVLLRSGFNYNFADCAYDVELGIVLGGSAVQASASGATTAVSACLTANNDFPSQYAQAYLANFMTEFIYSGIAPFKTALFRFDHDLNPATWLNTDLRKSVNLDIHCRNAASAAGGQNHIVLDRLVK